MPVNENQVRRAAGKNSSSRKRGSNSRKRGSSSRKRGSKAKKKTQNKQTRIVVASAAEMIVEASRALCRRPVVLISCG